MTLTTKKNLVSSAEDLLMEGFNPLPLKKSKAPMLPVGHNFLYSKIDNIESRFRGADMIGIACGDVSDGFYCIDFDRHSGQDLDPVFNEFLSLPTVQGFVSDGLVSISKTPSGGYHVYFKFSQQLKGTVFARYKDNEVMIEMRGHGQYVAVSPSAGYSYLHGVEIVKLERISVEQFGWIKAICVSFDLSGSNHVDSTTKKEWPIKWDDDKVDGKFNNESADIAKQLLIEAGWHVIATRRDGVELWQRPGKTSDQGISATFGSKFNMFYNFSQNGPPFEANKAYSPFNIYTILKFGGDWKKAKKSLEPRIEIIEEPEEIKLISSFPIDVFPKFIQDYIVELRRTLNFNPDFCAVSAMFTVATINGNRYKLKVKSGWEAQTVFWFACVGFPGTIKTHPVKTIITPIHKIDRISKEWYDAEMMHYDPDAKPRQPKPQFKQLLISDYTLEALHSIHNINKRGIGLYKDELVGFLNDMNKYRKGSDEQFWLESFNNGSYIINRVSKEPILLNNICINIIGTIQNDVLNKVVSQYAGNGLIDRFLFTASENKVYDINNEDIDDYYSDAWYRVLSKMNHNFLYTKPEETEIIKMTPEAFNIYQQIDKGYVKIQNSENENQDVKNYLSKMKTYVPRFALLLAVMESIFDDSYIIVDVKHMINAGRIADYFIGTARGVFETNYVNQDISEVAAQLKGLKRDEKILAVYKRGFKVVELVKFFNLSRNHIYRILKSTQDNL